MHFGSTAALLRARILVVIVAVSLLAITAKAAEPSPLAATGSRAAMEEAKTAIPWKSLTLPQQRMVQYVVRNASLYRRMPTRVIDCDPEVFNFLAQHPEVVSDLWKLMEVSNVTVTRQGDGLFQVTDSAGTTGQMRYLVQEFDERASNTLLAYGEGTYKNPALPREVTAKSVLLLRSASTVETNGRTYVTARLDSFVLIDRTGVEVIAKTFEPLMAKTADHNFTETMNFVSTFSRTAESNPGGMQRLAGKLTNVDEATRTAMVSVCQNTAERYRQLSQTRAAAEVRLAGHAEAEATK